MSTTANWSYTNTAIVWPHLDAVDEGSGWGDSVGEEYGEPYAIQCTWVGGGDATINSRGVEFVPKMTYFHEDKRVKFGDLIARGPYAERIDADPIQAHAEFDMSPFGEEPDYRSVT